MTRIDFYILQAEAELERIHFVAKLCDKAFKQGSRILIVTEDNESGQQVSNALWHYRPESFLPHAWGELADVHAPIVITSGQDHPEHHGLLINLSTRLPPMFSRFERVAEIVAQTTAVLEATRHNFAYYKARGYPINTHKL